MLWNWYTVDACFLSTSWHIRDNGMFAASCIGIALLVVSLEALRRIGKEYDAHLSRTFYRHASTYYTPPNVTAASAESVSCCEPKGDVGIRSITTQPSSMPADIVTFRASPFQQFIRALIHMITFGVAYIIMLLTMYFNGYIIISIVIGAFLGKFLCDWMIVKIPLAGRSERSSGGNGGIEEPTICCG